ncbi:MAG: aldehyde dehydrogenase family protein [Planctomycetales bacterium]|nr:aldehyde dehydrogenase family protein [Planctomycetales bacterium]NIM09830.1 aldehyde dehydrogenase family protein [Planctomycetales bacterium]NIN09674.1 aldehyde dehydrogenase family protein [Planctomycetales bacterium]NIN78789.1 aldehyde dehydrogenase family protein [Planctomycetales bacterium]NIO35965.1 aldehyde dehydrogenase family protein [Planctomycetales bacterium]
MQITESQIRDVVQQVLSQLDAPPLDSQPNCGCHSSSHNACACNGSSYEGRRGVFEDVGQAVAAATAAFEQLSQRTREDRERIIGHIRRIAVDQCVELGTMEMEETKIGRLEHKIEKLKILGERTPGVEFLRSEIFSGDHGLAVIEHAPFGVIGCITPVTHSLPTLTGNAISMIAGGNTLVVNPHPSGKGVAAEGVRRFNEAIYRDLGIDNLICVISEPTLESADAIFAHRGVRMICVTGGPAVARAALNSGKRAVVAGPGNPPVVVDETADLDRAAQSIIQGGAYDNNLLCIAEKEVFVVDQVFDCMMQAMQRAGGVRLNSGEIDALTRVAITSVGEGDQRHDVPAKEYLGKDASVLAAGIGKSVPERTELLFGETDEHNPFVTVEQMMPFIPFVRCRDADHAIDLAHKYEHGFGHTAIIHSNNVRNMTRMGRIMDTTLFVKNGPCVSALGLGGEGYLSFSIATPTGEGVTSPLTFTRERRCSLIDDLCILGKAD